MEEEVILSKIIGDAQEEADRIIVEAEMQAKKIDEENKDKALTEMRNKLEIVKNKIEKNSISEIEKAEFEARSAELAEKKRIIEIVKERVKQKIKELDEDEYVKLIDGKISQYKDMENVTVILPLKCYAQIKEIATKYNMEVLEPTDEFESGVIIKCGSIEYNYDFEENMLFYDEEIEKEIDTILFS